MIRNIPVEKAQEKLAALIRQVVINGEAIVLQTPDGLQAALVNLSALPFAMTAFTPQQELDALAEADAVRAGTLAQRGGRPLGDVSQELEALRDLRLLELQGMH